MTIELVGFPQSNTMRAVLIAASEKGVEYSVTPAMPHTPEIYAVHPLGKVPGMRHGSLTLGESTAICSYINENFDGPALMPSDPMERATIDQYVAMITTGLDPIIVRNYIVEYMFNKDDDGNVIRTTIDKHIPKIPLHLNVINDAIVENGYIASDTLTLADCHAYPIIAAAARFPESGEALADCPAVTKWVQRMEARDSVSSTAPQK